jgi:site-specific DNA-methyltransferase (adenine-specific)
MTISLHHGDCREIIPALGVTVDAVVTDPPYHLLPTVQRFGKSVMHETRATRPNQYGRLAKGFMGQEWDGGDIAADPETWRIVGSVLRPGGFLLAFGAPRTHHRLASAIEDAGLVIQDTLMWLYATGFPKRRDMLKPAYEPIVLAYKPGGQRTLQVDECRIATNGEAITAGHANTVRRGGLAQHAGWDRPFHSTEAEAERRDRAIEAANSLGRWPANICHDGSDEVVGLFPDSAASAGEFRRVASKGYESTVQVAGRNQDVAGVGYGDSGSAARFFFSAKAGAQDRWGSKHPTVKPVELMRWLVQLVTPPGGTVLDPFAGSGTTGVAALAAGRNAILIEREPQYIADIRERLAFYEGGGAHSVQAKNRNRKINHGPLFERPYDEAADAIGSYHDAIHACGERHKAGEPLGAYFLPPMDQSE